MLYIVTMYRWGDRDNHSYVHWAGRRIGRAVEVAAEEEEYRGGKYVAEVVGFDEDGKKVVVAKKLERPESGYGIKRKWVSEADLDRAITKMGGLNLFGFKTQLLAVLKELGVEVE